MTETDRCLGAVQCCEQENVYNAELGKVVIKQKLQQAQGTGSTAPLQRPFRERFAYSPS